MTGHDDLEQKMAITDLAARYSDLADHRRWDDLAGLFTDDAVFDATEVLGWVLNGRAEIAAFFHTTTASMAHHATSLYTESLDAESAAVRIKMLILRNSSVHSIDYEWQLVRGDGRWAIARQRIVPVHSTVFAARSRD